MSRMMVPETGDDLSSSNCKRRTAFVFLEGLAPPPCFPRFPGVMLLEDEGGDSTPFLATTCYHIIILLVSHAYHAVM